MTTFNSFPNEIQQRVFENIDDTSDICECMLVSKSWYHFFQVLLYSEMCIEELLQIEQFLHTLENNRHLGSLVKQLNLLCKIDYTCYDQYSTISELFTYLPKLEYIDCSIGRYFRILSDAMLKNQLPCLKQVEPPVLYIEEDDYITCAIMLRDHIKYIRVREPFVDDDDDDADSLDEENDYSIGFYRLFDQLGRFNKINHLSITKRSNNIVDLIENGTIKCPLLERLEVKFTKDDEERGSLVSVEDAIILKTLPAPKVNYLEITGDVFNNNTLLHYIMHKFSQAKVLKLDASKAKTTYFDEITLQQTLNYLKSFNYANIKFTPVNEVYVEDLLGMIWKIFCQSCVLNVDLRYGRYNVGELHLNNKNGLYLYNCICWMNGTASNHADVIHKYGQFIDKLTASSAVLGGIRSRRDLSDDFPIFDTLTKCTKLKDLSIAASSLGWPDSSSGVSSVKLTLDRLKIESCVLKDDFIFGNLSKLIAKVGCLALRNNRHAEGRHNKYLRLTNIEMPDTNIDTLSYLKCYHYFGKYEEPTILLQILTQEVHGYYIYDFESMNDLAFRPISKEIFSKEGNSDKHLVLNIKCKSLKNFHILHLNKEINLTVI